MRQGHRNTGFSKARPHPRREAWDENCSCERGEERGKAETGGEGERERERERERKRERESSLEGPAAGLSHLPEELEEVIAIGVCNMNRQHRGVGAEGRGDEHRLPRTKSC